MKYVFLFLLGYFLYRFIFGFVIPIYRTTKQVKKQFGDMQQKMQEQFGGNTNEEAPMPTPTPKRTMDKDYIEFEEVK